MKLNRIKELRISVKENTLEQTQALKALYEAVSISDTVRRAIELAVVIVGAAAVGDKIFIKHQDGSQTRLTVPIGPGNIVVE